MLVAAPSGETWGFVGAAGTVAASVPCGVASAAMLSWSASSAALMSRRMLSSPRLGDRSTGCPAVLAPGTATPSDTTGSATFGGADAFVLPCRMRLRCRSAMLPTSWRMLSSSKLRERSPASFPPAPDMVAPSDCCIGP